MNNPEEILDITSLARTLWNLEEARLAGVAPSDLRVESALDWLAERRGEPGSYRKCLFAPLPSDFTAGLISPTGENNSPSRAGVAHVLGEESARAMRLWGRCDPVQDRTVWEAIGSRFGYGGPTVEPAGRFCCYRCSVAWWRALAAGQPGGWEQHVSAGIARLRADREANGRYSRFPFYYTLLALSGIPLDEAARERR